MDILFACYVCVVVDGRRLGTRGDTWGCRPPPTRPCVWKAHVGREEERFRNGIRRIVYIILTSKEFEQHHKPPKQRRSFHCTVDNVVVNIYVDDLDDNAV